MIRRPVLIILTFSLILAAGLMTAIFISRRPTPAAFQEARVGQPAVLPCDEIAHIEAMAIYWKGAVEMEGTASGPGFVELTGYAKGDGH